LMELGDLSVFSDELQTQAKSWYWGGPRFQTSESLK